MCREHFQFSIFPMEMLLFVILPNLSSTHTLAQSHIQIYKFDTVSRGLISNSKIYSNDFETHKSQSHTPEENISWCLTIFFTLSFLCHSLPPFFLRLYCTEYFHSNVEQQKPFKMWNSFNEKAQKTEKRTEF